MIDELLKDADARMTKSLESLKVEFSKIRTGRAHTSLLDHVKVMYYDVETPLNQVANITVDDPRSLLVTPWEKQIVQLVEKAIRESNLGLNPATMGDSIRVPVPALTEERRRDLTRVVKAEAENARVAIRNIRRDSNAQLKEWLKAKEISEDDDRRTQERVQKLTDKFVADVEKLLQTKEADLMAV